MDSNQIQGNWKQLVGKVKERWGKLTDDELTESQGRSEFLAGKIQERYGQTREEARKAVEGFFKEL